MSRNVSVAAFLAAVTALSLFLAGCGPAKPAAKYQVAVIPKGLTHEFWQSIHRGADRAAADLTAQGTSVEVLWDGPSDEAKAGEQINLIRQKTGMGIKGLVLAPQHSEQMVEPVEKTVAKGIPVVIIDSGLDPKALERNPNLIVKYVATDNYHGGELAAQKLIELLEKDKKEEMRLVLFRYAPNSESTEQREQGFLDEVDRQIKAGKKITIVSKDKYSGPTVRTARDEAIPMLKQLRDQGIDGIFSVNESATGGMIEALRNQEMLKKVRLVGFDSSEPLLEALREGNVDGLVIQDPYKMGYLGVWCVVQHLEGKPIPGKGRHLSTGEYFLTKENMDSLEMVERFKKEAQANRKIEPPKD